MVKVVSKRSYDGPGVYVGRPSPLGNPFSHREGTLAAVRTNSREESIARYRDWLRDQWRKKTPARAELERLARIYRQTGELTLVCWCAPLTCHADVIADAVQKIAAKS